MKKTRNAIVLCSGGIDSVTTAFYVKKQLKYDNLIFLFFDYGQKTRKYEEKCVRINARKLKAEFRKINIPELGKLSTSLINIAGKKEVSRKQLKKTDKKQTLDWYVPFRNTVFLSYALALAENLYLNKKEKYDIFSGFICEGSGNFPDTTPEYLTEINKLGKFGIGRFKVYAPFIKLDKNEIIKLGAGLGVGYEETISCFLGENCGCCLNCRLRQEAFYWADVKDPTKYKKKIRDFRLA